MYVRKRWDVLLVDDEPDVLAVTRLALKHTKVLGIPLKIHECESKAQAIEFFRSRADLPDLSMAIIDVVMESEHAGLELCGYIRGELNNNVTQLIVRTGQAGRAPEREVIDRYDITGYITKVEATEDRLYSMVKSAIRQFHWSRLSAAMFSWCSSLVLAGHSRAALETELRSLMRKIAVDRQGQPLDGIEGHLAFFIGDHVIGIGEFEDVARAKEMAKELASLPRKPLGPSGHGFARHGELVAVTLASEPGAPQVECIARASFNPMPDYLVLAWAQMMQVLRSLWARTS